MKFIYCHCSLFNPGGMERVLLNKVRWLVAYGHQVTIVTTDQQRKPPFYRFPDGVRMIDLGINYSADNEKAIYKRIPSFLRKRNLHRRRLSALLMHERPDITVSLYPSESSFIPLIQDGSKKVLELHFNRYFRLQYGRKGLIGLIDRYRSRLDMKIARSFDRFIVLTNEDRRYWGNMPNISTIANAALPMPFKSDCSHKRVIAVGRLDYQKGFDRLIEAWEIVRSNPVSDGWRLDIFGQGEWHDRLNDMIKEKGLADSAYINSPTNEIALEYSKSSILAMTSHYEGFPMVMIEAMSAGVPAVTFDYKCGPKDIIKDGENGLIVKDGDIEGFAEALIEVIEDDVWRAYLGKNAIKVGTLYAEDTVMDKWMRLFENLVSK